MKVTTEHIHHLCTSQLETEVVLCVVDDVLQVWTQPTAQDHDARIVTTGTDVWEYMDGAYDQSAAEQLATDLTADLNRI